MQRRRPTKDDIIEELRLIRDAAPDGRVSKPVFKKETGWGPHWFDKFWPTSGYQGACEEAGVKRGAIFGVDRDVRVTDDELAVQRKVGSSWR